MIVESIVRGKQVPPFKELLLPKQPLPLQIYPSWSAGEREWETHVSRRQGLSWEESNRDWGEEGREGKKQRARKRRSYLHQSGKAKQNTGTWKREAEWERATEWVHGWIRTDQYHSLIRWERKSTSERRRERERNQAKQPPTVKRSELEEDRLQRGMTSDGARQTWERRRLPLDHFRAQRRAGQRAPGGPEGGVWVYAWLRVCRCNVCGCGRKSQAMSIILKPRSRSTSSLKNTEGVW